MAESMSFGKPLSTREKMRAARGPRRLLWVVVVTTSQCWRKHSQALVRLEHCHV